MVRVKVLGGFCIGGGVDAKAGDVMDVDPATARAWVTVGHVAPEPEPVAEAPRQAPGPTGDGEALAGDDASPADAPADAPPGDDDSNEAGDAAAPTHPEETPGAVSSQDASAGHRDPRKRGRGK